MTKAEIFVVTFIILFIALHLFPGIYAKKNEKLWRRYRKIPDEDKLGFWNHCVIAMLVGFVGGAIILVFLTISEIFLS